MTEVFEDQITPVFYSSVAKKCYKIHLLDNQSVEAFEILNAKKLFDTLEFNCCYNVKLILFLFPATETGD